MLHIIHVQLRWLDLTLQIWQQLQCTYAQCIYIPRTTYKLCTVCTYCSTCQCFHFHGGVSQNIQKWSLYSYMHTYKGNPPIQLSFPITCHEHYSDKLMASLVKECNKNRHIQGTRWQKLCTVYTCVAVQVCVLLIF